MADIAQLVEQLIRNQQVTCSNHVVGSTQTPEPERNLAAEPDGFEKDPTGYVPLPDPDLLADDGPQPIRLDSDLSARYLKACATSDSVKYWRTKRKLIAWWLTNLAGKNLRRLDLALDILSFVPEGTPSRQPKIAVLKHFFGWMRDVQGGNLIDASEDPTLDRLHVPQSKPEQTQRPKTFTQKNLTRALAQLEKMGQGRSR